ncbi:hypothetical protein OG883_11025 [Streptomyces sp. NBC_01142]|nr:hypothetical protein [Streptomyces sp. NBC_01142]MCX4820430.1 hypothetical protein [Streptomyces sp. NBC_01142]
MSYVPDHTARQRRVVLGLFIVAVVIAAAAVLLTVGLLLTRTLPQ